MLVHHFLEASAQRLPDKMAIIHQGRRITYAELDQAAMKLANFFLSAGVQHQDRVVLFMDNSPEAIIALFAVLKAGAIFILPNATMKAPKLNHILRDSGATCLVAQTSRARVIAQALSDTVDLDHIVWYSGKRKKLPSMQLLLQPSVWHWNEIMDDFAAHRPDPSETTIDVDLATIIYTSGSTGDPKGVMCTHGNVVAASGSIIEYLENREEDVILSTLPLSFDYGLYQVLMAFRFGGTVILEKSFVYPVKVLEKIEQYRVTGFPLVPTMAALIFELEDLSRFDFSSLRYITNTAAALPPAYIAKLSNIIAPAQIFSMYGLTECKRVSYLPPAELSQKPESVGIPIPGTTVSIVDEDGHKVPPGVVGELTVRGPHVMQGYWQSPGETAKVFRQGAYRSDCVLYTGDNFRMDDEGYLYFVGRKDDMIKTKGERVSPREIENTICEMDQVVAAAAVGIPDDIYGQAIKVFVVPKQKVLTSEMIKKHCQINLEPFMVPKLVEIRSDLPQSVNQKVDTKKITRSGKERRRVRDRRQITLSMARERRLARERRRGKDRRR
jgi:amino acid adenylation domain-containing protein